MLCFLFSKMGQDVYSLWTLYKNIPPLKCPSLPTKSIGLILFWVLTFSCSHPSLQVLEILYMNLFMCSYRKMCNFPKWPCSNVWTAPTTVPGTHACQCWVCLNPSLQNLAIQHPTVFSHLSSQWCFLIFFSVLVPQLQDNPGYSICLLLASIMSSFQTNCNTNIRLADIDYFE